MRMIDGVRTFRKCSVLFTGQSLEAKRLEVRCAKPIMSGVDSTPDTSSCDDAAFGATCDAGLFCPIGKGIPAPVICGRGAGYRQAIFTAFKAGGISVPQRMPDTH